MSTPANRETLTVNSEGQAEKRAETVEYRSSAGQSHEQKKPVQITHQPHDSKSDASGSVLANAAASVATTLQSAKEAISRE